MKMFPKCSHYPTGGHKVGEFYLLSGSVSPFVKWRWLLWRICRVDVKIEWDISTESGQGGVKIWLWLSLSLLLWDSCSTSVLIWVCPLASVFLFVFLLAILVSHHPVCGHYPRWPVPQGVNIMVRHGLSHRLLSAPSSVPGTVTGPE